MDNTEFYLLAQATALAAAAYIGASASAINRVFRAQDESHLYPFCGRFNATERAIRKVRRQFAEAGLRCEGLDYANAIEATLTHLTAEYS